LLQKKTKALSYKEIKLKKNQQNSDLHKIFEAINMLIKSTKYDMELYSTPIYNGIYLTKMGEQAPLEIMVFLPILAFNGDLYSWTDNTLQPENEILLEGRCHTKSYFDNMLISIVEKDHFRDFLSKINKDRSYLVDEIYDKKRSLDEQLKIIKGSPYFNGKRVISIPKSQK
jgi:hypothetical protein